MNFAKPGMNDSIGKGNRSIGLSTYLGPDANKYKKELHDQKKSQHAKCFSNITHDRTDLRGLIKLGTSKEKF